MVTLAPPRTSSLRVSSLVRPWLHVTAGTLWLGGAVLVAVLLRVLWIVRAHTFPVPLMDTAFYDDTARRLAAGLGYTTPEGTPTAIFPPGYPFLLAAAYRLFGPSLALAQGLNVLISAGLVVVTYALGCRLADRRVALVAAWGMALLPSQVLWSALVMSELPFTLVLLVSIALFARGTEPLPQPPPHPAGWRGGSLAVPTQTSDAPPLHRRRECLTARGGKWGLGGGVLLLLAGLLGGYAALTRGQALGLPLVALAWALWTRRSGAVRATTLYTAAFLLVLLPWAARNVREVDRSVLLSSNVGWNAVVGHNDQADGGFWSPLFGHVFDPYLFLPPRQREVAMHQAGLRMARAWALRHPARESVLAVRKAGLLWSTDADAVVWQELGGVPPFMHGWERAGLTWLVNGWYAALLVLSIPVVIAGVLRRDPLAVLVFLLALYWTAFHMLFFAEGRYHFPLLPLLCLTAATGLQRLPMLLAACRRLLRDRLTARRPASVTTHGA